MHIETYNNSVSERDLLHVLRENYDAVEVTCDDGTFTADGVVDIDDRYWRNPGSLDPSYDWVQFANINGTGEDHQVRIRDIESIKILPW